MPGLQTVCLGCLNPYIKVFTGSSEHDDLGVRLHVEGFGELGSDLDGLVHGDGVLAELLLSAVGREDHLADHAQAEALDGVDEAVEGAVGVGVDLLAGDQHDGLLPGEGRLAEAGQAVEDHGELRRGEVEVERGCEEDGIRG